MEHRLFAYITMNWRGQPLTSHEVILATIAATATGLRVHAKPGTSIYDTGVKVSDQQMKALPLDHHDWHGDWNYTLRPETYDQISGAADPFDRPSPDLAWLAHPALTGLPAQDCDALISVLLTLHGPATRSQPGQTTRSPAAADCSRHRPPPLLTLTGRLLATSSGRRLDAMYE